MQQREANLTALAAIGPRKKRPLDSSNIGSGLEVQRSLLCSCIFILNYFCPSLQEEVRILLHEMTGYIL